MIIILEYSNRFIEYILNNLYDEVFIELRKLNVYRWIDLLNGYNMESEKFYLDLEVYYGDKTKIRVF